MPHRSVSIPSPSDAEEPPLPAVAPTSSRGVGIGMLSLISLVLQNSALVLMTRYSRFAIPREHMYATSTLVLNQEILKLVFCIGLLAYERGIPFSSPVSVWRALVEVVWHRDTLKLSIPAAMYTFQNFLLFIALSNLDAMMFQVVSQTKLLSAAIFSVWMLDHHLTWGQWGSLLLLTIGILFGQVEGQKEQLAASNAAATQSAFIGILACVASGISSSFAGVYFEKVVKTTPPSLAVRNIHLGVFGVPFAILSLLVMDAKKPDFQMWRGYDLGLTWMLVVIHALGGLLVAVVVKYTDNILKGFATGVAIFVTGLFTWMFWQYKPSNFFVLGAIVVVVSSIWYQTEDTRSKRRTSLTFSGATNASTKLHHLVKIDDV